MSERKKTALIIGAGPAGLTAAYELLKNTDIIPIVFEESDTVGGISKTVNVNGDRMDMGGHRFFSKSDKVNEIWNELLPMQGKPSVDDLITGKKKTLASTTTDPQNQDDVMLLRNRVSRIYFRGKFFDYPVSLSPKTLKAMGFSTSLKAGADFMVSSLYKRDEKSLEDFYINRFGQKLYEMFFKEYTTKLWGVEPKHLSKEWGVQRVKSLSLATVIKDFFARTFAKNYKTNNTSLINQFKYPKFGPGQLWEKMAKKINEMGGKVLLNSKVVRLYQRPNKITSIDVQTNGEITNIEGDYFFTSMPIKDLVNAMKDIIPLRVFDIGNALPYRDFITVGIKVKKLNVRNRTKIKTVGNIVPDCWIYMHDKRVKIGRLQIFNNWSPYMVKNFKKEIFMGLEYFCNEGDELWSMTKQEFSDFAVDELCRVGMINKQDVILTNVVKVKKAYPGYFGSYKFFGLLQKELDKYENLYCIGRNGQHRYNNMDHSMLTAIEAVKLVKNNSKDKSALWNVNTDDEYHEAKK